MDVQIPDPVQPAGKLVGTGTLARLRRPERSGERLRWGLTGLAAIFLIVMLAAARLGPARVGRTPADQPGTGEPLAVLGVAPGPATRPADPR
jgi:hypothetical protein